MSVSNNKLFLELVPRVTEVVKNKVEANIAIASKGKPRGFQGDELLFIVAYVTAMSDILCQHSGGEATRGAVVETVIVRALQEIFGDEEGEPLMQIVFSAMSNEDRPAAFNKGLSAAVADTNEWLNGKQAYGIGRKFIEHFSA